MKAIINFKKDSPYSKNKESQLVVDNLTEIHYSYPSSLGKSTAFKSDIEGTGFTIRNEYIEDFEITP